MAPTRAILAVLAILLVVVLLGANVAMGLDRGPLDDGHVTDTLDDTDSYAELQSMLQDAVESQLDEGTLDDLPGELDMTAVIEDTLTEEYLRGQVDSTIEQLYAFLHGETETLDLIIQVDELKDNLETAVSTQVADLSISSLGIDSVDFPVLNDTVTAHPGDLDQGQQSYESELASFEEAVKASIQEQTEPDLSEDELDDAYDDMRQDLRDEVNTAVETAVANAGLPSELESAAIDLAGTIADAYTTDLSYDEFSSQLDADKEALGSAAVTYAFEEGDLIPDEINIGENINEDELSPAVSAISLIGTLALVLPLVALLFVGLMYLVIRDVVPVAKAVGIVAIIVGTIGIAVTMLLPGLVDDMVLSQLDPSDFDQDFIDLDTVTDLTLDIFSGLLDPLFTQSLLLVVVGGVLLVGGFAYQRQRSNPSNAEVDDQSSTAVEDTDEGADENDSDDAEDPSTTAEAPE